MQTHGEKREIYELCEGWPQGADCHSQGSAGYVWHFSRRYAAASGRFEKGHRAGALWCFRKIADAIFAGKAKEIYPGETKESSEAFAHAIASLQEDKHESD